MSTSTVLKMAPNGMYYNAEVDDETGEEVSNTLSKPEKVPIEAPRVNPPLPKKR